jgi:hypothetical protein
MNFVWALIVAAVVIAGIVFYSRRRSIAGMASRNRYFSRLAKKLQWKTNEDTYFLQMEGEWKGTKVWIYPHNFEGPGSITLLYADSAVPFRDRTWIEPTLSLGRAVADWKRHRSFSFEIAGDRTFFHEGVLSEMKKQQSDYPFVAVTVPGRFLFSPLLVQSLQNWPNFVVFLAIDAGRKPPLTTIEKALDAAASLCRLVKQDSSARPPTT